MNAIMASYEVSSLLKERLTLQIFPFLSFRHFHAVTDRNKLGWSFVQKTSSRKTTVQITEPQSTLILSSSLGHYVVDEKWVEDIFFRIDNSQGNSCFDDNYVPGLFEINLKPNQNTKFHIVAVAGKNAEDAGNVYSTICEELKDLDNFCQKEINRYPYMLAKFQGSYPEVTQEDWLKWLILTANSFVVNRSSTKTKTVIAGYPWFEDWGRDSLISLPGLTFVTGQFADAKEILLTFKHYCKDGIVPNRFPDQAGEKPVYNTVDATLWYLTLFFNT